MKTNFTPGRWYSAPTGETMRDGYSQSYGIAAEYTPGHHTIIAGVFGDVHGGESAAAANAALLAEAPAMLEALQLAVIRDPSLKNNVTIMRVITRATGGAE